MKKYLFIFLVLMFVSGIYAQEFKFIGGPIISNYSEQWPPDSDIIGFFNANLNPFLNHKIGLLAGIGIEFTLNKNIALEIDGLYFLRGSIFVEKTPIWTSIKEIYSLNGFDLPVLVKIKFLPNPFPYILAGGDLSLILSHTRITLLRGEAEPTYKEISRENLIDSTKKVDFGPVVGLGIETRISKGVVFIEGRYNHGLKNLLKSWWYWDPHPPKIKTCSLEILAGLKI